jgi:hypothetical protein
MASGCLSAKTQKVASKILHTTFTLKENFEKFYTGIFIGIASYSRIPSTVAALRTRWNDTKHRASPHCIPNNSDDQEEEDDEEEDDVNDEEGGEMGTTGLVFGHDESEDESDDSE